MKSGLLIMMDVFQDKDYLQLEENKIQDVGMI